MPYWRRGPNGGIKYGLGLHKAARQADAARARLAKKAEEDRTQGELKLSTPTAASSKPMTRTKWNNRTIGGALVHGTNALPKKSKLTG